MLAVELGISELLERSVRARVFSKKGGFGGNRGGEEVGAVVGASATSFLLSAERPNADDRLDSLTLGIGIGENAVLLTGALCGIMIWLSRMFAILLVFESLGLA